MRTRKFLPKVIALIKDGMNADDFRGIAKTVGCSISLVARARRELGMPPLPVGGVRRWTDPKRVAEARRLKVAGYTYAHIAKVLGCSRSMACVYLRIPGDRSGSCEGCGYTGKRPLHCHHTSYEDQTKFKMLCPSCHSKEHPEALEKAREVLFG